MPGAGPARSTVAVVTDSAASLPASAAEELGIVVVPMTIAIGSDTYPDGTLSAEEVLRRTATGPVSTSAPAPGAYLEVLEALRGRPALIATVSQRMSASFESATAAAAYVPPDAALVLDTRTAAGGQGLVVLAAAAAARRGEPLAAVAAAARRAADRVRLWACVGDFDRLARSGRVPGIAAWAGRSLGVRPVFEFVDGAARPRWPARSVHAALERIVSVCAAGQAPGAALRAAVVHALAPAIAAQLHTTLQRAVPDAEVYSAPFSSVMVAHTGRGLAGLAWWWDLSPSPDRRQAPLLPSAARAPGPTRG